MTWAGAPPRDCCVRLFSFIPNWINVSEGKRVYECALILLLLVLAPHFSIHYCKSILAIPTKRKLVSLLRIVKILTWSTNEQRYRIQTADAATSIALVPTVITCPV